MLVFLHRVIYIPSPRMSVEKAIKGTKKRILVLRPMNKVK
jgi:hypothetical protein